MTCHSADDQWLHSSKRISESSYRWAFNQRVGFFKLQRTLEREGSDCLGLASGKLIQEDLSDNIILECWKRQSILQSAV